MTIIQNLANIFTKLEESSAELVEAEYKFRILDDGKKSYLATLEIEHGSHTKSQAEIARYALADKRYTDYLKGLNDARKKYLSAKFSYQNRLEWVQAKRTREVTERDIIRKA
jgi:hypothetical protein